MPPTSRRSLHYNCAVQVDRYRCGATASAACAAVAAVVAVAAGPHPLPAALRATIPIAQEGWPEVSQFVAIVARDGYRAGGANNDIAAVAAIAAVGSIAAPRWWHYRAWPPLPPMRELEMMPLASIVTTAPDVAGRWRVAPGWMAASQA